MKEIPSQLQCAYCIRNNTHGGECKGRKNNDIEGCLIFKMDERGCIRNGDFKLPLALYQSLPNLNMWCDDWQVGNVDTEIRMRKIYGLEWDTKNGYLIIKCNCDYFINEYHDNYIDPKEKPKLKIIK